MKKKKFLRTGTKRYKKLGRRNKLKWRRARGRHSKIRNKRKSRARKVEIGYKKIKKREKIILVENLKQAERVEREDLVVLRKVGKRKKIIIENKIKEKGGKIVNRKKNELKKEEKVNS